MPRKCGAFFLLNPEHKKSPEITGALLKVFIAYFSLKAFFTLST